MQPGDQVSFELVSPRRLVVQVISTEDSALAAQSNSNATSPIQEDNPGPQDQDLTPMVGLLQPGLQCACLTSTKPLNKQCRG